MDCSVGYGVDVRLEVGDEGYLVGWERDIVEEGV